MVRLIKYIIVTFLILFFGYCINFIAHSQEIVLNWIDFFAAAFITVRIYIAATSDIDNFIKWYNKNFIRAKKIKVAFNKFCYEYLNTLPNSKEILSSNDFNNKMFTKNDIMPHQVKITKVFLQSLQGISNADCLKEGIIKHISHNKVFYTFHGLGNYFFDTPSEAYSCLIDKLGGKGTWDKNEWVWAIEFELIK